MLHTKFCSNRLFGPGEEDFEGVLPYMEMRSSLSYDQDAMNKLSFPYPRKLHVKFGLAELFRKCLKLRTDERQTDAGAWEKNKLTYEPSALGN